MTLHRTTAQPFAGDGQMDAANMEQSSVQHQRQNDREPVAPSLLPSSEFAVNASYIDDAAEVPQTLTVIDADEKATPVAETAAVVVDNVVMAPKSVVAVDEEITEVVPTEVQSANGEAAAAKLQVEDVGKSEIIISVTSPIQVNGDKNNKSMNKKLQKMEKNKVAAKVLNYYKMINDGDFKILIA